MASNRKLSYQSPRFLYLFFAIALLVVFPSVAFCQGQGDAIIGKWKDESGKTIVQCFKQQNEYFAKVLWVENEAAPSKPLPPEEQYWINSVVMKNFKYDQQVGEWNSGLITQLKTGKTYSAYCKMVDSKTMIVTGYVFLPIFCEHVKFYKINS